MTVREWLALVAIMGALLGATTGIVRWLFSGWMKAREKGEEDNKMAVQALQVAVNNIHLDRSTCQARHDRELADVRLELALNYPSRAEIAAMSDKIDQQFDRVMKKLDELQAR
jgi:hypothetical protein